MPHLELDGIAQETASGLRERIQPGHASTSTNPPIALLGPSGPDFLAHVLAAWYLGFAIMPIATGTSASGIANLLRLKKCQIMLVHESEHSLAADAISTLGEHAVALVTWSPADTSSGGGSKRTGQDASAVEALHVVRPDTELVIFHSSGSTGNPKPIPQLHRFWTKSLTSAAGTDLAAFTTTPLFHGGLSDLFRALQAGAPIYFFSWHEGKPPTTQNILASVDACSQAVHYFLSVPFLLEMLVREPEGISMLQQMDLVSTGGAPLPENVGDAMVKEYDIPLVSRLGSSECGFLMSSWRDFANDKEWSWLRIYDEKSGQWLELQERSEEGGLFELVVKSSWPTKVNGKKVASSPIETALKASAVLSDAIVFGAGKPFLGAIVLPKRSTGQDEQAIFKSLEPILAGINKTQPSHAYLSVEMVQLGEKALFDKLPRSSKGTLQRGLALAALSDTIDAIYDRFERGEAYNTRSRARMHGPELRALVQEVVRGVLGRDIKGSDDFFAAGVDSVKAMRIRATLLNRLDLGGKTLSQNVLYEHATLDRLCDFLDDPDASTDEPKRVAQEAQRLVDRYSAPSDFTQPTIARDSADFNEPSTFLVTGGTGALGSRIIAELLQLPSSKCAGVYCVARAADDAEAQERIFKALEDRKCPGDRADWAQKLKCLNQGTYLSGRSSEEIKASPSLVVIHCAWTVNFALSLASFEQECIAPLRALIDLYQASTYPRRFLFCSSLASILSGPGPHTEMPSTRIESAGNTGYAQSKWVAEQICARSITAGGGAVVARVGQLCGDTAHGIWNETEAYPLLVRTAVEVGCLPSTGPEIDWLPVDTAAKALVEVAISAGDSSSASPRYLHIAMPSHVLRPSWADFVDWLAQAPGLSFERVSKDDWLSAVRKAGAQIRGRALVHDIWANLSDGSSEPTVSTQDAEAASPSLSHASTVDAALCTKFAQAWQASGFL
ncbi:hypothetical protein OC842_006536 [Tilletia horrida]|uniref:Carrier domain-containing protein n=1 Tax=Tilletia horrida TaxID=155126 RepID=A0AAN6JHH7_9BASI|nr:hypothetical protein OC842_006536 [Tilletia horrida]